MSYAKELLTAELTDWLSPLEKIYARQTKQLQEHHSALRDRDKQLVEKAKAENLPDLVKNLATFSTSIRKLKDARETSKKEKDASESKRIAVEVSSFKNSKDVIGLGERAAKREDLLNDQVAYNTFIDKELPDIFENGVKTVDNAPQRDFLKSQHGGNFYRFQDFLVNNKVRNFPIDFQTYLNDNPEAQLDYDALGNDPVAKRAFVENWLYGELNTLNVDNDFIADNYYDPIQKALNTKGMMDSLTYSELNLTAKAEQESEDIDVARGKLETDPFALTRTAQRHILLGIDPSKGIDKAKSTANYAVRLERLALDGGLTQIEWDLLKSGELPIPHAAGSTGSILFTEDQKKRIQSAINEHNTKFIAAKNATWKASLNNIEATIGKGNLPYPKLLELKEEGLLFASRTFGVNSEEYRKLEAIDVTLQDPNSYAAIRAPYEGFYNNGKDIGKLLQEKENFKTISNERVKTELLGFVTEAEAYLTSVGMPTTHKEFQTASKDLILSSPAQKVNLKRDTVFSRNTKAIQLELTNTRLAIHLNNRNKFDNVQDAYDQSEKIFKQFLEDEGFNVKDVAGNEELVGRLSPNAEGEYVRALNIREARIENRTKPSNHMIGIWTNRAKSKVKEYGNVDRLLEIPEALNDKEDTLGAFVEPNEQGDYQLYYSPELISKSLALGKQPGYVLIKNLEALIKDKRYADFVDRFKLKDKLKELQKNPPPDLKLKEILEKHGNKDFISQYNYGGVLSFSTNDLNQILIWESGENMEGVPIVDKLDNR